jgi:hypothetical protein
MTSATTNRVIIVPLMKLKKLALLRIGIIVEFAVEIGMV